MARYKFYIVLYIVCFRTLLLTAFTTRRSVCDQDAVCCQNERFVQTHTEPILTWACRTYSKHNHIEIQQN